MEVVSPPCKFAPYKFAPFQSSTIRSVVHIVKLSFVEHLPWCVDVQVNANGVNSLPNRESTGYRWTNAEKRER